MTFTVPRPFARIAVMALTAGLAAVVLAGCTQDHPAATDTPSCTGHVKTVLLGDDSATTVVDFDPAESPKQFGLPASPAPTCAYRDQHTTQGTTPSTVVHRTYLYIGISADDAQKLIAALGATGGKEPWVATYASVPAPSSTPAPYSLQTVTWSYTQAAGAGQGQERGTMSYAYNAPVNPGIAIQAGLKGSPNVLRIETEVTSPAK
jgi:hypothetical protein